MKKERKGPGQGLTAAEVKEISAVGLLLAGISDEGLEAEVSSCELGLALQELRRKYLANELADDVDIERIYRAAYRASDAYQDIKQAAEKLIRQRRGPKRLK